MIHQETIIRAKVVELIIAAGTMAGANVFPMRKANLTAEERPAICVYMMETDSELESVAPVSYKHESLMVCELWLSPEFFDEVANPLDAFRLQVEHVLAYNMTLGDTATDNHLDGTEIDIHARGNESTGDAFQRYSVTYYSNASDIALATAVGFEALQTEYNLNNEQDPDDRVVDKTILEGGTAP